MGKNELFVYFGKIPPKISSLIYLNMIFKTSHGINNG